VRRNETGELFAKALTEYIMPAAMVSRNMFDYDSRIIKVMTIHSAKGLEFPFAVVVREDSDQILNLAINDQDEKDAQLVDDRRLLSVGLSRAMRRLALVH
jgi:superfamily I DNA/RNA helicase